MIAPWSKELDQDVLILFDCLVVVGRIELFDVRNFVFFKWTRNKRNQCNQYSHFFSSSLFSWSVKKGWDSETKCQSLKSRRHSCLTISPALSVLFALFFFWALVDFWSGQPCLWHVLDVKMSSGDKFHSGRLVVLCLLSLLKQYSRYRPFMFYSYSTHNCVPSLPAATLLASELEWKKGKWMHTIFSALLFISFFFSIATVHTKLNKDMTSVERNIVFHLAWWKEKGRRVLCQTACPKRWFQSLPRMFIDFDSKSGEPVVINVLFKVKETGFRA